MASLRDTALVTMDLFYQDYKKEDDFFSEEHFFYLTGVAYAKLLELEYKSARDAQKRDEGFTDVILQPDWQTLATVEVKRISGTSDFVGELPVRPFSFPFDEYSYGIQRLRNAEMQGCRDFIRATSKQEWALDDLPISSKIFFFAQGNQIVFKNVKCSLKKVRVYYIPEITDEVFGRDGGQVPGSKRDDIIKYVISLMRQSKEGTIVDTTNNSNPNRTIQTEIDSHLDNIRNKPV